MMLVAPFPRVSTRRVTQYFTTPAFSGTAVVVLGGRVYPKMSSGVVRIVMSPYPTVVNVVNVTYSEMRYLCAAAS
eukprot:986251-Rhodomonas_salina.2